MTLPAFFVISGAVLLYFYFSQLPLAVQQASQFLPYVLGLAVLLMALFFNQSGLFYLGLVNSITWLLVTKGLAVGLHGDVLLATVCLVLVWLSLLPEKGLLTFAAWATHLLVGATVGLAYGLLSRQPDWFVNGINSSLWPTDLLSSSSTQQPVLLLVIFTALALLTWLLIRQLRPVFNALLTLVAVVLICLWPAQPVAQVLVVSSCLLALLFSGMQQAWHLAYVDELTELPGRRALEEKLQRSLGIYALAMVDVDHFKKFNDSYGHDVGDDVLRMIAAKIDAVSGGGRAFRYGGEEFTIVFNNHSADEIKPHLQELLETIADTPFVVNRRSKQKPKKVQVTVSIGLTDSIHKTSAEATIKAADEALYQAKKKGRNRIQVKS